MRRTISCLLVDEEQVVSLASILALLKGYLDFDWVVEKTFDPQAALVLVNREDPRAEATLAALPSGMNVVGCATKPRQHAAGTIHRPFRGYQILALLKEAERRAQQADAGAAVQTLEADDSRIFKLNLWPVQFRQWPRDWWRVLAALRKQALTIGQLAEQTGVARTEVARCLDALLALNGVSVTFNLAGMQAARRPLARQGLWARIGSRVVGLLRQR